MTLGNKRSIQGAVEERLTAMRRRLPERTKKTVLQGYIAELDGLLSLHADGVNPDYVFREGRTTVGLLRTECIRIHGRDIWEVPEVKSAVEGKMVEFYARILKHNMAVCFEALEKHVDNAPLLRYRSGDRESVSVVEFEKRWERSSCVSGLGENHVSVEFELPGYKSDGIEWGVKIVTISSCDHGKYFANDARPAEMGCENPKTKMLGLVEYVNTCLCWPRVHRAECLYDAIYDVLEKHIRRLATVIETPGDLQQVLSRLKWSALANRYK
jgi:hypothetical protein